MRKNSRIITLAVAAAVLLLLVLVLLGQHIEVILGYASVSYTHLGRSAGEKLCRQSCANCFAHLQADHNVLDSFLVCFRQLLQQFNDCLLYTSSALSMASISFLFILPRNFPVLCLSSVVIPSHRATDSRPVL